MLATITFLFGVLLGTRFKFFVLVPAIMFVSIAVAAAGAAHADSISAIMLAVVIATAGLQVGYLAGLWVLRTLVMIGPDHKEASPAQRPVSGHAN
jgi:membrane protein DedA with SNARE-associated domain